MLIEATDGKVAWMAYPDQAAQERASSTNSLPVSGVPIFLRMCVNTSRKGICTALAPTARLAAAGAAVLPLADLAGAFALSCWTEDLAVPGFDTGTLLDGAKT